MTPAELQARLREIAARNIARLREMRAEQAAQTAALLGKPVEKDEK